jgi:hypothetical protein
MEKISSRCEDDLEGYHLVVPSQLAPAIGNRPILRNFLSTTPSTDIPNSRSRVHFQLPLPFAQQIFYSSKIFFVKINALFEFGPAPIVPVSRVSINIMYPERRKSILLTWRTPRNEVWYSMTVRAKTGKQSLGCTYGRFLSAFSEARSVQGENLSLKS